MLADLSPISPFREATFAAKSDQFKANQVVRTDELTAIGKAIPHPYDWLFHGIRNWL